MSSLCTFALSIFAFDLSPRSVCAFCLGPRDFMASHAPRLLYMCNACMHTCLCCIYVAGFGLTMVFINTPNSRNAAAFSLHLFTSYLCTVIPYGSSPIVYLCHWFRVCAHSGLGLTYCRSLPDPRPDPHIVPSSTRTCHRRTVPTS